MGLTSAPAFGEAMVAHETVRLKAGDRDRHDQLTFTSVHLCQALCEDCGRHHIPAPQVWEHSWGGRPKAGQPV